MESKIARQMSTFIPYFKKSVLSIFLVMEFILPANSNETGNEFYSNDGADTARFSKHLGKILTISGWLGSGKEGLTVIEDKTHAQISIEPLSCPKGGQVVQKFIWTGTVSYRTEYPLGGFPSKRDYQRLCNKIEDLRKAYNVFDTHPYVTVTGTVCHLRTVMAGIENHRRCSMPRDHFFFCAKDVQILPAKKPKV